jgi:hypothetical protein
MGSMRLLEHVVCMGNSEIIIKAGNVKVKLGALTEGYY